MIELLFGTSLFTRSVVRIKIRHLNTYVSNFEKRLCSTKVEPPENHAIRILTKLASIMDITALHQIHHFYFYTYYREEIEYHMKVMMILYNI